MTMPDEDLLSKKVKTKLTEHFGRHIERDMPFSRLKDAAIVLDEDRPFFAMGLKSSAVNALSSEIG